MASEVIVEITNKRGLHARAAAKFVKVAASYTTLVQVTKMGSSGEEPPPPVGGASILGLMMLGADPGSKLLLRADGAQEAEVLGALKELIENKFGEGE